MNQIDEKYKHYLFDLGYLLKTRALEAKNQIREMSKDSPDYYFHSGRLIAFNEVVSLVQQEAIAFGISLKDLRLEDIDPDQDLLPPYPAVPLKQK